MSETEDSSEKGEWQYPIQPDTVGESLAPQLGSDQAHIDAGVMDMRRLSVISSEDIPVLIYAKLKGRRSRFWRDVYDEYLNLKVSTGGGRGRRDLIRMESVSKGGSADVSKEITKEPGWVRRNVTDRNWEEKQRRQIEDESQR